MLEEGEASVPPFIRQRATTFCPSRRFGQPKSGFLSRSLEDEAIGTGAVALNDGWAEIKRMRVDSAAKGQGLSKAILARLETEARRHGIGMLRLETGIHNHDALALYKRSGFERREPFADYLPDPLSVFMEKRLS